jgi:hypothetical protein
MFPCSCSQTFATFGTIRSVRRKVDTRVKSCTPIAYCLWLASEGTLLHALASSNHGSIVMALLFISLGIDIAAKNSAGECAMFVAATNGHHELVSLLLNYGAVLNGRNRRSLTILHAACLNRQKTVVEQLLANHCDIDAHDRKGKTPLMMMCHEGFIDMVVILLQHGASVTKVDLFGWTPLHFAASAGHLRCVQLLVQHFDAPVRAVNKAMQIPADLAEDQCLAFLQHVMSATESHGEPVSKTGDLLPVTPLAHLCVDLSSGSFIRIGSFSGPRDVVHSLAVFVTTHAKSTCCLS